MQETASNYADYITVNMNTEMRNVYETIEEMQLRLEEFTSIVGMLQSKGDKSINENIPRFLSLQPQVNNLCKRIDALDFFITRVNLDLATLETNMEIAESALTSTKKKFVVLNPFSIFKKSPKSTVNLNSQTVYQKPQIFKIEDYFQNNLSI